MLKYIKGVDYQSFDHGLFVGLIQAQFPGTAVNSEGDGPLGPGSVTVDLPDTDQSAILEILTTSLPAAIAAQELAQDKTAKNNEIMAAADAIKAQMLANFSDLEQSSFPYQLADAVAWTADNTKPTPWLTAMAAARGTAVAILAPKVIANNTAWTATAAKIIGQQQKYQDALTAATTVDQVNAINPIYNI
jgi:hypothetical protein